MLASNLIRTHCGQAVNMMRVKLSLILSIQCCPAGGGGGGGGGDENIARLTVKGLFLSYVH
jgi:hypothetical protein